MLRCYLPCCLSPHIQIKIVLFFPLFIKRTHTHCENVLLRQYLIERSKFHNQVNLLITFFFWLQWVLVVACKILIASCRIFYCCPWTLFGAHVPSSCGIRASLLLSWFPKQGSNPHPLQ